MGCIYCGKTTDLNTSMSITLEGGSKVSVDVCDEHAEDATIKTARDKYAERQKNVDALAEMAKSLGLTLVPTGSVGLVKAELPPKPRMVRQPVAPEAVIEADQDSVDSEEFDRRVRMPESIGGSMEGASIERCQPINVGNQKLPDGTALSEHIPDGALKGRVKYSTIEGRNGRPQTIETMRQDGLGTTRINIVETSDVDIQKRFKQVADMSRSESGWDRMRHLGREGIQLVDCTFCRASGMVKHLGSDIQCPKCKGKGIL